MTFPVIICRAQPGADQTAETLENMGFRPVLSPSLELVDDVSVPLPEPSGFNGLVFTSANGVRAFQRRSDDRATPAWCVGPATAEAARRAGFGDIFQSSGDAVALAHFIAQRASGPLSLIHIANRAATGQLKATLLSLGHHAEFAPLYEARPAETLTPAALQVLKSQAPVITLLHSQKGAKAFVDLIGDHSIAHICLVAISERCLTPFAGLAYQQAHIAEHPDEEGLMAALREAGVRLSIAMK